MNDQDRAGRRAEDFFRHRAEEQVADAGPTVAAHDDEVGGHLTSVLDDRLGGRPSIMLYSMLTPKTYLRLQIASSSVRMWAETSAAFSTRAAAAPRIPG
jgi:hypothetical protein